MSIRFGRSGNGYNSSEVMETEDDDWRKVTDLNERRKIQNRLAQRNYRRKLRQRLEELERQAGQTSGSSSSISPQRKSRQLPSGVGTIIAASARDQTTAGPTGGEPSGCITQGPVSVTLVEERLTSLESLLSPPSVSGESEGSPTTSVSSRGLYTNEFGSLFLRPTAGTSEQTYSIWPPVQPHAQYPQPQPYNPRQPYLPNVSSLPPPPPTPSGAVSPESLAASQHHIQAYIPPSADHSLPVPLTPTVSLPQDSNTSISYQPHARQGVHIELPEKADFPVLPPTYSPNPNIIPNPWHLNPPLPHDEFYLTLNYSKLYNATMSIAKILNIQEADMLEDDTPSPFYREDAEEPPFEVPESAPDLRPTRMQQEIQHHPYIDVVPFKGFRDKLLDYVQKGDETGNYADEADICHKMYESWGVWGECPWEGRSWEIGEAFAREFWFLMDDEMVRSTNWWRRQRGLGPLPTVVGETEY